MASKPVVAILLPKSTQQQVFSETTVARLNERFDARWPKCEGKLPDDEAAGLLAEAEACMTGWSSPNVGGPLLAKAPKLRLLAHSAGTVKPYVSDELWKRGIVVTSAAAGIAVDVAHYTIGLMSIGRKNIMEISPQVNAGAWRDYQSYRRPESLRRSVVGIIAASHVGRNVLNLLKHFDVTVLLYDPFCSEEKARELGAAKVELDDLFRRSDIVSVHAPSIPETRHMVNAQRLALLKNGAVLINTSRGTLIDEAALVSALKKKRIWAFLDVTDSEPPAPNSPLYNCPNLTLSPHLAGSCGEVRKVLGEMALEELDRFFKSEKPMYPVTQEMLERIG